MRLFIAITFSPPIRSALLAAIDTLRRQGAGNFTWPENLHLTLAFIGETADVEGVRAGREEGCAGGPFSISLEGVGHFGDLWWAGLRENPRLEALARRVADSLGRRGFPLEKRPWRPHITLVRRWRGPRPVLPAPRGTMTVRRISLMKSERIQGRLVYTELYSVPL